MTVLLNQLMDLLSWAISKVFEIVSVLIVISHYNIVTLLMDLLSLAISKAFVSVTREASMSSSSPDFASSVPVIV